MRKFIDTLVLVVSSFLGVLVFVRGNTPLFLLSLVLQYGAFISYATSMSGSTGSERNRSVSRMSGPSIRRKNPARTPTMTPTMAVIARKQYAKGACATAIEKSSFWAPACWEWRSELHLPSHT